MKNRLILIGLWILIFFFAFKVYDSINGPIEFNKVKEQRYTQVINRLKDIRDAQVAHKSVTGVFSPTIDGLIRFIDTAQYTLVEKRDSSYLEYDRTYRIDMLKEVVVIDTLGFASVKDSLFKNSDRYKNMAKVPVSGIDAKFEMKADVIDKNGFRVAVFQAKVKKDVVLHDQDKNLLKQENALISVDGVNGSEIIVGSLSEVSTNGNWPTIYDSKPRQ